MLFRSDNEAEITAAKTQVQAYMQQEQEVRKDVKTLIKTANPKSETKDTDYVFINFVIHNLPVGVVGLLLAVIFSAAMSSKSSEINALATTSVVDIYKRQMRPNETDAHYKLVSQWLTAAWGALSLLFAVSVSFLENLIEAVNIIGSLFYGAILGLFMVAFFMKRIGAKSDFLAAIVSEILVIIVFTLDRLNIFKFAYLWLNFLGCALVMLLAWIFHYTFFKDEVVKPREYGIAEAAKE